jgi:hypothetical protein
VARSTIAAILKAYGIPSSGERPTSWRTFLRAHWRALVATDFFTTDVWTARGLVTYYTVFVLELQSRRIHVAGSTRYRVGPMEVDIRIKLILGQTQRHETQLYLNVTNMQLGSADRHSLSITQNLETAEVVR